MDQERSWCFAPGLKAYVSRHTLASHLSQRLTSCCIPMHALALSTGFPSPDAAVQACDEGECESASVPRCSPHYNYLVVVRGGHANLEVWKLVRMRSRTKLKTHDVRETVTCGVEALVRKRPDPNSSVRLLPIMTDFRLIGDTLLSFFFARSEFW